MNKTRKINMKGSGKRPRIESLPNVESIVSNTNIFGEGGADKIIDTFIDFLESLNKIDDKLLDKFSNANDKKKLRLSEKRDKISMIKIEVAEKLINNYGSKAKNTSPLHKADVFDDELSNLLSGLSV